jgi:biotin synthase
VVQAPLSTSCNPPIANSPGESETPLREWLNHLAKRIIAGDRINREEAIALTQIEGQENILLLCEAADKVRQACCGNTVDLCSIVNIKSGNCSENCGFCAQSAHHPGQESPIYGLKSKEEILAQAKAAESAGAKRFCLVSQGRGPKYNSPKSQSLNKFWRRYGRLLLKPGLSPAVPWER